MSTLPVVAITSTDATGSLGGALATLLVARGHRVAIYHDERNLAHAQTLVRELGAERVHTQEIELEAPETWEAAVEATRATFGMPAHAVLGFDRWEGGGGLLHDERARDPGRYGRLMVSNTEAVYRALRVFLRSMVEARSGSVVVLSRRLAVRPWEAAGAALYAASKAAGLALVSAAAEEVRDHGVRVNAIVLTECDGPEARTSMPDLDATRWVPPEAVARTVAFLVSDDAREITGAMIPMYGRI